MLLTAPLWAFLGYLTLTVVWFAMGPWPWPVRDPYLLYGFLFLAHVAFWIGYVTGIRPRGRPYGGGCSTRALLWVSLIACILWFWPWLIELTAGRITPGNLFRMVAMGIARPDVAYAQKIAFGQAKGQTWLTVTLLTLAVPHWMFLPLAIFRWPHLSWRWRATAIVVALAEALSWIAIGTTKGLADLAIVATAGFAGAYPNLLAQLDLRNAVRVIAMVGTFSVGAFWLFALVKQGPADIHAPMRFSDARVTLDKDHPVMRALPTGVGRALATFSGYETQGYYALALALREPFMWSEGLGNSYFAWVVADKLGAGGLKEDTYPAQIDRDYGWSRMRRWQSIYTWLASDLSFPGVILFMAGLGWLIAQVWRDLVEARNPLAACLFPILAMIIAYAPGNPQVFHFFHTAIPFWVLVPWWGLTRVRFRSSTGNGATRWTDSGR